MNHYKHETSYFHLFIAGSEIFSSHYSPLEEKRHLLHIIYGVSIGHCRTRESEAVKESNAKKKSIVFIEESLSFKSSTLFV